MNWTVDKSIIAPFIYNMYEPSNQGLFNEKIKWTCPRKHENTLRMLSSVNK